MGAQGDEQPLDVGGGVVAVRGDPYVSGARHVFRSHPMERVVRDAATGLAHAGTRALHAGALATAVLADPDAAPTTSDADAPRAPR
ncbi:MAG: hypothetical protein QOD04_1666 [Pseudonocardiales bacterium]|nr:hypothetical protein [Pseudonocardiales bacterium]